MKPVDFYITGSAVAALSRRTGRPGRQPALFERRPSGPAYYTLAEAQQDLRIDLVGALRKPGFNSRVLDPSTAVEWYEDFKDRGRGRYRIFHPYRDLVAHHQLTAEIAEAEPDLIKLYEEKIGPLVIKFWEQAYGRSLDPGRTRHTGLLPEGIFSHNTFQGRLNWDIVFKQVATDPRYMGLALSATGATVPHQLSNSAQADFLRAQLRLGEGEPLPQHPWRGVMRRYLLEGGLKAHYGDSPAQAFFAHYPGLKGQVRFSLSVCR